MSDDKEKAALNTNSRNSLAVLQDMLLESTFNETSLFLSLKHNFSDELICTIIEAGWDVNCQFEGYGTPLHFAVKRETTLVTGKLLKCDANPLSLNSGGYTPLHIAIKYNRLDQLLELLKWIKEPLDNIICSGNETLLMHALFKESSDDILLAILNHGCDVNIQDEDGFAALHYCSNRQSTLIAQKIIENGANINIKNNMDDTPLHSAVFMDNLEYVCMLLYNNAAADEKNKKGKTPFHEAIYEELGCEERPNAEAIARHLLNYVTDFEAKTDNGNTVFDTALRKHTHIVPDLLERGFNVNILRRGFYNERVHSLYLAWRYCNSYEVLELLWSRTNFELFIETELFLVDTNKTFLEAFCVYCKLPDEQFLQYLYMMFDSPYIQEFICRPRQTETKFFIYSAVSERNFTLKTRVELICLLSSYDVQFYFADICSLYEKYGFDESVELLLTHGCIIPPNPFDKFFPNNLTLHRICYDNVDEYVTRSNEYLIKALEMFNEEELNWEVKCLLKFERREITNQNSYCKFYRATFYSRDHRVLNRLGISGTGELPSLLELSRNVVRKVIYKKWSTPQSFQAYQALSKLPVPSILKKILYLKTPIYTN